MAREQQKIPDVDDERDGGLSVPTKLTLAFTSLIVLSALGTLLIWVQSARIKTTLERTEEVRVPAATASANARAALLEMTSSIRGYLSLSEKRFWEQYERAHVRFLAELDRLDHLMAVTNDPEADRTLLALKATYADWAELPEKLKLMHENPVENRPALKALTDSGEPLIDNVLQTITAMIEEQATRTVSQENTQLLKTMADFRSSFADLASGIHGYVGTLELRFKEQYQDGSRLNEQHWRHLEAARGAMSKTQQTNFKQLADARDTFLPLPVDWIFPAAEGDESHRDLYMLRNSAVPLAEKMDGLLRDLVNEQNDRLRVDVQQARSNLQLLLRQTVAVTLLTIVIGTGLALIFRRAIIRDIGRRREAVAAARDAQRRLLEIEQEAHEQAQEELATARGELVKSTRLATIGQMTASIAHEIRNPLGAVRNAAFLLKRKVAGDPKQMQYLDIIDSEVNAVDRVIRDMLEMARAKEPIKVPFDVSAVVRNAFDQIGETSSVRFDLACTSEPTVIVADQEQMGQVIRNLLVNSVQAMNGKGEIRVELRIDGEHDLLLFRDTGPGVKAEHREQLFEPLFTTKAKGTGLGLAICRQIVESHGGTVELQDDPGDGATFCVRLPRGKA